MTLLPEACAQKTLPDWKDDLPECVALCENENVARLSAEQGIDLHDCEHCVCDDAAGGHVVDDHKIANCKMECRNGFAQVPGPSFPPAGASTCDAIAAGIGNLPKCKPRCANDLASVVGLAVAPATCDTCVADEPCDCNVMCEDTAFFKVGSWSDVRTCSSEQLSLSRPNGVQDIFCMAKPPVPVCPILKGPGLLVHDLKNCAPQDDCLQQATVSCHDAYAPLDHDKVGPKLCKLTDTMKDLAQASCSSLLSRGDCLRHKDLSSDEVCCWNTNGLLSSDGQVLCAPMKGSSSNFERLPEDCTSHLVTKWDELPVCKRRCNRPADAFLAERGVVLKNCDDCIADEVCQCTAYCNKEEGFEPFKFSSEEHPEQLGCTSEVLDFVLPVCLRMVQPRCDTETLASNSRLRVVNSCDPSLDGPCTVACATGSAPIFAERLRLGSDDGTTELTCTAHDITPTLGSCSDFTRNKQQCLLLTQGDTPCCFFEGAGSSACVPKGSSMADIAGMRPSGCTPQTGAQWEPMPPVCHDICYSDFSNHPHTESVGCLPFVVENDDTAACGLQCRPPAVMTNHRCGIIGGVCPPVQLVCQGGKLSPKEPGHPFPSCSPTCDAIEEVGKYKVVGCQISWPQKPDLVCEVSCATGTAASGRHGEEGARKCIMHSDGTHATWNKELPECVAQCFPPTGNPLLDTSRCDKPCTMDDDSCTCGVSCKPDQSEITTLQCISALGQPVWHPEVPTCSSIGVVVVDAVRGRKLVGAAISLKDANSDELFGEKQVVGDSGEVVWHTKMVRFEITAEMKDYFTLKRTFEWEKDCASLDPSLTTCVVTVSLVAYSELSTKGRHDSGKFGEMYANDCSIYGSERGAYYVWGAALSWMEVSVDLDLWVRAQSGQRTGYTCGRQQSDRLRLDMQSNIVESRKFQLDARRVCKADQCCVLDPRLLWTLPAGENCDGCSRSSRAATGCAKQDSTPCSSVCCDYLASCLQGASDLQRVSPQVTGSVCQLFRNQYPTWVSGKTGARFLRALETFQNWEPCGESGVMCSLRLETDRLEGGGAPEFTRMENLPPGTYQIVANVYRPESGHDMKKFRPRVTLSLGITEMAKGDRKVDFDCEIVTEGSDRCAAANSFLWYVATIHVSEGKVVAGGAGKSYKYAIRILDTSPSDPKCADSADLEKGCMPKLRSENFPTQAVKQGEEGGHPSGDDTGYFIPNYFGAYQHPELVENICYGKCRTAEGSHDFQACLFSAGVAKPS